MPKRWLLGSSSLAMSVLNFLLAQAAFSLEIIAPFSLFQWFLFIDSDTNVLFNQPLAKGVQFFLFKAIIFLPSTNFTLI